MKKITVVVPAYNEEKNISEFFYYSKDVFKNSQYAFEYIFINDGSEDNTYGEIEKLVSDNPDEEIIGINFSKNFGKESAMLAGLKKSTGDYVSIIDADLQQDPKYILEMANVIKYNEDIDTVACYQEKRKENKLTGFFKSFFYKLINSMSNTHFEENASDFRLMKRNVVEAIISLNEYNRFSKGIFSWVGFNVHYMPYEVKNRANGKSKWSMYGLFKYALDGFVGFSTVPLKFAMGLGLFTALISGIYLVVVVMQKLLGIATIPGYTTIISIMLLLSGIQLITIGIIGEYLGKTYMEVKNRPHYIIKDITETEIKNTDGTIKEK